MKIVLNECGNFPSYVLMDEVSAPIAIIIANKGEDVTEKVKLAIAEDLTLSEEIEGVTVNSVFHDGINVSIGVTTKDEGEKSDWVYHLFGTAIY